MQQDETGPGTPPPSGNASADGGSAYRDQASSQDRTTHQGGPYERPPYGGPSYGAGPGPREALGAAAPRLLDDLARLVTDAAGAAQGVRREVETVVRSQAESALSRMDVVRRDDFEVVREMVSRLRAENDELRARIEALEAGHSGT